ncbi:hypothetical protein Nepgr_012941 [Nepenthes gracilis]|uniref:Uncharacterized protein n=1 Tax=Nepenthes gracilis TaxID=150966 RepID=A0AAD3XNV3_NEPGR|nr:hypothetical protein Nepgr_012941 [Nepenthes gracilis]
MSGGDLYEAGCDVGSSSSLFMLCMVVVFMSIILMVVFACADGVGGGSPIGDRKGRSRGFIDGGGCGGGQLLMVLVFIMFSIVCSSKNAQCMAMKENQHCESSSYYYLEQEETAPAVPPFRVIDVVDFASLMAVIYSMVKQGFVMQEKVVSSLNLKTSAGELGSYCPMWSLQPMVNDDVIHEAFGLVP